MARVLSLVLALSWWFPPAFAQGADYHGKATVAAYETGGDPSLDVNLRYAVSDWTGWVGYYGASDRVRQGRAGVEYDLHRRGLFLAPSAQIASEGFAGASLYAEVGPAVYVIAGASRTNLHPYANLTFDPNESWQLGAGWRVGEDSLAGYTIWDNRLHTGQQITHVVFRHYLARARRLTLDTSYKSGRGDAGLYVRGAAESIEYDFHRRWFVKGAVDEHANYGRDTMLRAGAGWRF